jgi:hypothetical protein
MPMLFWASLAIALRGKKWSERIDSSPGDLARLDPLVDRISMHTETTRT